MRVAFVSHRSCVVGGGSSPEPIPHTPGTRGFHPAGSRQTCIIGSASNCSLVLAQLETIAQGSCK